ncbi:MAG: HTTM domain-containing protein [Thermomicrobiales bacterium]
MRAIEVRTLMRLLIGTAALIQAVDMAILFHVVFDEGKLRLPLYDWLPVLPGALMPVYFGIWLLSAIAFATGLQMRLAGVLLVFSMMYAIFVDQQTYSNHVYLLVIVMLLLMLPGSLPLTLLRWQMSIVYFFAAVSKINIIYISGLIVAGNLQHGWLLQLPDPLFRWEAMLPIAVGSICLELFLAVAFWIPRYRPVAFRIGVAFHLAIVLFFPFNAVLQLIVFALTMDSLYLLFLDPVVVEGRVPAVIERARNRLAVPARP